MTTYLGLTGGGNITLTHARAAKAIPGVEIAAVLGTNAEKVNRLCAEFGGMPFHDLGAFVAHRPMDMVVLGSPSGVHAAEGIAAARSGLHVLTEKPIDVSTARADLLIDAARQANVKAGVIFQDRGKPQLRQLKNWIDRGLLGKLLFVDARVKWYRPPEYYAGSRWRGTLAMDGGGALINQGIHTVDLLLWLLGDVARVKARIATLLHSIEAEDTANALLDFVNGAQGVFHATTAAFPGYPRRVEITGTEGTVILEHDRIVSVSLRTPPEEIFDTSARDENQSSSTAAVSDFRGHQTVVEDFLQAIREQRAPLCDAVEGRRSLALVEAIYRAAKDSGAGWTQVESARN